jgi:hypothetical protein
MESEHCVRPLTPGKEAMMKQDKKELDKIEKICYNHPYIAALANISVGG